MPNKRARGWSVGPQLKGPLDQTTGFISYSDLAGTGIEPVICGDTPFPNSAGSVCSPWAFGPRATLRCAQLASFEGPFASLGEPEGRHSEAGA